MKTYSEISGRKTQILVRIIQTNVNYKGQMQMKSHLLLTGAVLLPAEQGGEGIRLGVQELVRMGLKIDQIPDLAQLISEGIQGRIPAGLRDRVRDFSELLTDIHFCYSHELSRLRRS